MINEYDIRTMHFIIVCVRTRNFFFYFHYLLIVVPFCIFFVKYVSCFFSFFSCSIFFTFLLHGSYFFHLCLLWPIFFVNYSPFFFFNCYGSYFSSLLIMTHICLFLFLFVNYPPFFFLKRRIHQPIPSHRVWAGLHHLPRGAVPDAPRPPVVCPVLPHALLRGYRLLREYWSFVLKGLTCCLIYSRVDNDSVLCCWSMRFHCVTMLIFFWWFLYLWIYQCIL